MNDTEMIARCMATYAYSPEVQVAQTAFRRQIVDVWGIPRGAKVLEVGCGQGDLTAVLAHVVGTEGHVTACDPARPDYGAPVTLGDSTDFLKRSALGDQITFHLQWDLLNPANAFQPGQFDYAVLAHCTWYFDSIEILRQTLLALHPWAQKLCLSEWDLFPQEPGQLAHALAVLAQGQVEAFRTGSEANVRTPYTRDVLLDLLKETGWEMESLSTLDSSDLQDGGWEAQACVESSVPMAIELGLPQRFVDLVKTEVSLVQRLVETHGRKSMTSFAVIAKRK